MSKEYFSHDYGTRNKIRMAALLHDTGSRGYGLFWIIVEMLHEDSTKWMDLEEYTYTAIKKESGEDIQFIRDFIEKCISTYKVFMVEDNKFTTERVLRNIEKREEIKGKRSEAGKKSAEAKAYRSANSQQNSTSVDPVLKGVQQNSTKEKKGKERKGKDTNRANALVVSDETTQELRKEYDDLISVLGGKDSTEVYTGLKTFIQEKKPAFAEPYVDAWNLVAAKNGLEVVRSITDDRKDKIRVRVREPDFDFFKVLASIRQNKFYLGENNNGWKVTFNYIIKSQKNYTEILEKYKG
jgi:hypothetical protein